MNNNDNYIFNNEPSNSFRPVAEFSVFRLY